MNTKKVTGRRVAAGFVCLCSFAIALWWTWEYSLKSGLGADAGFYLSGGGRVLRGEVPYVDFYYLYTPLFLYSQHLYHGISGGGRFGWNLEIWLHHLGLFALIAFVLRRFLRASWEGIIATGTLFFPLLVTIEGFYYLLEMEVNLWGWLAIALALNVCPGAQREPHTGGDARGLILALCSGISAGISLGTKQVGLVFLLIALLIPALAARRPSPRLIGITILGAALPLLTFWLAVPGTFRPFFDSTIVQLGAYVRAEGRYEAEAQIPWFYIKHWFWVPALLVLSLFVALDSVWRSRADGVGFGDRWFRSRVATGLLLAGLVLYFPFLLRGYPHYLQLVLPMLLVGTYFVVQETRRRPAIRVILMLVPLVAACTTIKADIFDHERLRTLTPTLWDWEVEAGRWIRDVCASDSEIYVLGKTPQLYPLSGKYSVLKDFTYGPGEKSVRQAAGAGVPIILITSPGRGNKSRYSAILRDAGYEPGVSRVDIGELWLPRRKALLSTE